MKERVNQIIDSYLKSFNTVDEGWSRKKVVASIVVLTALLTQLKWIWKTEDFAQLENILIIDFAFASTLLGVTAIEKVQLSKVKKPKSETLTEETIISQTKTETK